MQPNLVYVLYRFLVVSHVGSVRVVVQPNLVYVLYRFLVVSHVGSVGVVG